MVRSALFLFGGEFSPLGDKLIQCDSYEPFLCRVKPEGEGSTKFMAPVRQLSSAGPLKLPNEGEELFEIKIACSQNKMCLLSFDKKIRSVMLPPKTLPKNILRGLYVHQSHQIFRIFFPEFAIFSQIWLIPLADGHKRNKRKIKA
jgi:hypothetical protein